MSSSLVAFGFFAAATHRPAPVLATVLPALIILAIFTFVRLVETVVENVVLLRRIILTATTRRAMIAKVAGGLQYLVTEAELSREGRGLNSPAPWRLFLRGFFSFRASTAEDGGRLRTRAGRREMITLKHLVAAHNGGPGPYLESWPKAVMLILLIAVVAGTVAIWNRSRYHP